MMNIQQPGRDLIRSFETLKLTAYPDPGTGGDPWTCGWGCTGSDIGPGTVWTPDYAEQRFEQKLSEFEAVLNQVVTGPINQNMFDALGSFVYNVGPANLKNSTLLKLVNVGDFGAAADEFTKWNKAAGQVLNGLTRRRLAERTLFLTPYG